MSFRPVVLTSLLSMLSMLPVLPASAQVVREAGTKSIAGVLAESLPFAEWTFRSSGGEILFASLDAEIYLTRAHEEPTTTQADDGCGGGGGGCEGEGGPGLFYLSVIGPNGSEICRAERPAPPPGWQRDPRMACVLPDRRPTTYTLRVGLLGGVEHTQPSYPFLLDVSLRSIAPVGVNVQEAIARSGNHF
jgi:hypothetical protein